MNLFNRIKSQHNRFKTHRINSTKIASHQPIEFKHNKIRLDRKPRCHLMEARLTFDLIDENSIFERDLCHP